MLNVLIPYIDQSLTEFTTNYGLAELVTEVKEENPKTFPAVYSTLNDYKAIEIEKLMSYHRVDGEMNIQETEESTRGCTQGLNITYPMILLGALPREADCDQYASDIIANGIASKLKQVRFTKEIKALVKSWSVEIILKSVSTNRNDIWTKEYRNIPMQANFDVAYFSVSYELSIKADSGCLNLLDCTAPVVLPPSCAQVALIPNERLKCLTQEQIEYIAEHYFTVAPINIVPPSIQYDSLNYGSVLTAVPGEWIGSGVTYSYKWYRDGVEIAIGPVYNLGISDTTQTEITLVEFGTNFYGSGSAESEGVFSTLLPETSAHYQRVVADSGTLSDFSNLNTLFGNTHFINDLVCVYDPGVFGYKLNTPKVSKVYSVDVNSDISQALITAQPLFLDPSTGRFARVRTDNIESDISAISPVFNSQGPQILQGVITPINGARGPYLSTVVITSVAIEYQTAGNQLNYVLGGSGFTVPLGAFTPAAEFYIRGYYYSYPTYRIDVSNDGNAWTNVHSATHTQSSFTITRYGMGRATLSVNGPSNIFSTTLNRGVVTYDVDLANFNPVVHSRQWTNNTGLIFNIASVSTADDIYPTQIVTELTAAFDGVNDKMTSGAISFPAGALTIYAIVDWGMIQTGTRYVIDDAGGKVSIWTDGTNIFVGESGAFINAGLKPTRVTMLTFVKNGLSSSAQVNQGSIITGSAGTTMPANMIVGGQTGTNINNAALTRHKIYAFNGADSLAVQTITQNLLNSIQGNPLF